jgi:ubiquinone/menaquinone biosynthesis C-methylase UbiE
MANRLVKYGKSSSDIANIKQEFICNNHNLLMQAVHYADIYGAQERRKRCKICESNLSDSADFYKHGVDYSICTCCGHLNGLHEDTDDFCSTLYTDASGKEYAKEYIENTKDDYMRRVDKIYTPKVQFLFEILNDSQRDANNMNFADFGAGAGYFAVALEKTGASNVQAFDVNLEMLHLAKTMSPDLNVTHHSVDEVIQICESITAEVVSLIGVLEHLQKPNEVLKALVSNQSINYLYISVPMFSPTVFFEMVFNEIMPRHLAKGHTHLFTSSSLEYLERKFKLERQGEWWFGNDIADLYRNIMVTISNDPNMNKMLSSFDGMFKHMIDQLQLVIDENHLSSEIHVVYRIVRDIEHP